MLFFLKISPTAPFLSISIIASITCSTLIYESSNCFEISSAFINTSFILLVAVTPDDCAASPKTLGILSIWTWMSLFNESILTPIFSNILGIKPSFWFTNAENKWIISNCWLLYLTAIS